jgi:hypothetical protein
VAAFGVETITAKLKRKSNSHIQFLKTHLTACAKEQHLPLFMKLLQTIYSTKMDSGFAVSLGEIIHFQTSVEDSLFHETALTWAARNENVFMVLELLYLEYQYHNAKKEEMECLQDSHLLSNSSQLLAWINQAYRYFKLNNFTCFGPLLGKICCSFLIRQDQKDKRDETGSTWSDGII